MTSTPTERPQEVAEVDQTVFWLGLFYALIGVASFAAWALIGDGDGARNRSPIDLPPFFGLLAIFAAISLGLRSNTIRFRLTLPEKVAAGVLGVAIVYGIAMNATHPQFAINGLSMRATHLLAAMGLCYILSRTTTATSEFIIGTIPAQTLLHMPIVVWLYVFHVHDPSINWAGGPIGYWHVRIWGMILAAGLCATIGIYAAHPKAALPGHILTFVVLFLLSTALFWSGGRAALLGVGGAVILSTILLPGAFLRALPLVLAALVAGAGTSLVLDVPYDSYGALNSLLRSTQVASGDALASGRLDIWREALAEAMDHPYFGHGFDQYFFGSTEEGLRHSQPHNFIVQFIYDFGFLGGAAALFLLLSLWVRGVARTVQGHESWKYGALSASICLGVMALLDGAMYHNDPLLAVAICFAVLLARPEDRSA
ncbi:O-antigen ligase family protein [Oceanibium sediminis]|uniref:O-antigen ligase family protein n=1 Tax=Oceanibium sediminis TaxID=2026339 RepID=UPI000DD4AB34|nr:O-antigen ligase family protein [Oceanibium sediminis]